MGRISGRQWGIPMAASGENYMAAVSLQSERRCWWLAVATCASAKRSLPGTARDLQLVTVSHRTHTRLVGGILALGGALMLAAGVLESI